MIKILYSDESILIIDKPTGVRSIADGYLVEQPHLRTLLEPEFGRLWIVHRLDKETSGVMVLARSISAHHLLNDQFANRQIKKQYKTLVFGKFPSSLQVASALKSNGDRSHRTVVNDLIGKKALTDFALIEIIGGKTSFLSVYPHTGFTHQIRAHLLSVNFPILADPLYSSLASRQFSQTLPIHRTALHAYSITFEHPASGEQVTFTANLPDDFQYTLDFLNQTGHPD